MTYSGAPTSTTSRPAASWSEPLPADQAQTLLVLDTLSGDRAATDAMLRGHRWLGAELAGAQGESIQFAQAATGTMSDSGPSWESLAGRGSRFLLRRGNALLTAAQLLQQLRTDAERAQVANALERFGLDATVAADVCAARAYVWSRNLAGSVYWEVPYSGPVNDRVAIAIMRHERDNPGTLGLMTEGDRAARAAIDAVVASAVVGTSLAGPLILERRRSLVANPALSTTSSIARAVLGITGNQSWIAHHLLPFAEVAKLLPAEQLAMAAAGWTMDSAENLIALPRNYPTYLGPMNVPRRPWHAGSHPQYSAAVGLRLQPLAATFVATPATIRVQLLRLELRLRGELVTNVGWHAMLP